MRRAKMVARYEFIRDDARSRLCSTPQLQESLAMLGRKDEMGADCTEDYRLLVRQCSDSLALSLGRQAHLQIKNRGYDSTDTHLCNMLILMYNRCGSLREARQVFDAMKKRDVFTWNFIISAYAKNGHDSEALNLYTTMDAPANSFVYASALAACANLGDIERGREIHRRLNSVKSCRDDVVVQNALVTMYSKCGRLDEGRKMFDKMRERSLVSWNAMISAYVQSGQPKEALELYHQLRNERLEPNRFIFASILTACADLRDLETGKAVHRHLEDVGLKLDGVVENALLNLYGKCGKLDGAEAVLERMRKRDVCVWNTLITAYGLHGLSEKIFGAYERLRREMVKPDEGTLCGLVAACRNLEEGKRAHQEVINIGLNGSVIVGTALMVMYSRCGSLEDAKCVFESLTTKDAAAWAVMLTSYEQHGEPEKAIELFKRMVDAGGVKPTASAYASAIQACSAAEDFEQGLSFYRDAVRDGLDDEPSVQRVIVNMYCKSGDSSAARKVFEKMENKDVMTWTTMIGGFVQLKQGKEALKVFESMKAEGVEPDYVTHAAVLGACSVIGDLELGKRILAEVPLEECGSPLVASALVNMYAKCGCVESARRIFEEQQGMDVLVWNAMIIGYIHLGYHDKALEFYHKMNLEGVVPSHLTFLCVLMLCEPSSTPYSGLEVGRELHARINQSGYDSDLVKAALVRMYCRFVALEDAKRTFDGLRKKDLHLWNVVLSAYSKNGEHNGVLEMYKRMDVLPDKLTFSLVLIACSTLGLVEEGKEVHERIVSNGLADEFLGNVLVTMYAKFKKAAAAKRVFDDIKRRTVVSWTAMIAAYTQGGQSRAAIELYNQMDVEPDDVTYACLLNACADLKALDEGMDIYTRCVGSNKVTPYVTNSLQNLYSKCGLVADARKVFDKMSTGDRVCWNAMITAYAQHAQVGEVLELYQQMELEGVPPDRITLLSILVSCSHAGKFDEARSLLLSIIADHGLEVTSGHHRWIVDMLGRAGHLADAEEFIKSLQWTRDVVPWKALLGCCRNFGDTDTGSRAAMHVTEMEPQDAAPYLLMPHINAAAS